MEKEGRGEQERKMYITPVGVKHPLRMSKDYKRHKKRG